MTDQGPHEPGPLDPPPPSSDTAGLTPFDSIDAIVVLATLLVTARKARHLTQKQLADRMHVTRTTVSTVERAERNVGFNAIRVILLGLGMDWGTFGAELQKLDPLPLWNPPAPAADASNPEAVED